MPPALVIQEVWVTIKEFSDYSISNLGRVHNDRLNRYLTPSQNNYGHLRVAFTPMRITRSVALLVAENFVEPPDNISDSVIVLDGDLTNVAFFNLAWRPRWYAYQYAQQLRRPIRLHFKNLHVRNDDTKVVYESILAAAKAEGLLLDDIWDSVNTGRRIYPYHHKFKIWERV